ALRVRPQQRLLLRKRALATGTRTCQSETTIAPLRPHEAGARDANVAAAVLRGTCFICRHVRSRYAKGFAAGQAANAHPLHHRLEGAGRAWRLLPSTGRRLVR